MAQLWVFCPVFNLNRERNAFPEKSIGATGFEPAT